MTAKSENGTLLSSFYLLCLIILFLLLMAYLHFTLQTYNFDNTNCHILSSKILFFPRALLFLAPRENQDMFKLLSCFHFSRESI